MYLSKLEIFGFKSFAHKVQFHYTDGITAVIGPNGCGKSNIVDAIRWVLGEQRTSLLRLDRMENVIFNGTATRKPLSMAEVSLYIENTRNILPSVYNEVKITRRLFRSGESDYLINNRIARLKDVVDLFADTGMGSDAYSVIELKMVEQILSENAEERRRLFEEAAGIKKYKFRRKSALRKLDATDQELTRLSDVLSEVQKNVNSLSRQVGKARRYHEYRQSLQNLELTVYHLRMQGYQTDAVPLREEKQEVHQTREGLNTRMHQGESELEKLQLRAVDLEKKFREVSGNLQQVQDKIRELEQQIRLNEQKSGTLQQNLQKSEREKSEGTRRLSELEKEKQELDSGIAENRKSVEEQEAAYRQFAEKQKSVETELEKSRQAFREFSENSLTLMQEITRQKEVYQKIMLQKSNLENQAERLQNLQNKLKEKSRLQQQKEEELQKDLQELREEVSLYQQEMDLLRGQISALENERPPLESQKNSLIGQLEKVQNQRSFLQNLIENYEGFSESVQFVMTRREDFRGLIDTLANIVDIQEEYRPALENYLGELSNYLVVEEVDTARRILQEVRHQKKGRLTLIPMDNLYGSRNGAPDYSRLNGSAVPLKKMVRFDNRFEKLFTFLFDHVILVEDMDTALSLQPSFPQCQFLTREGELLGSWGQLTGGDSRLPLNLTGRKQQHSALLEEHQKLEAEFSQIESALAENARRIGEKKSKLQEFEKLLADQQNGLRQVEKQAYQQEYEASRSREQLGDIQQESESLAVQNEELQRKEAELLPGLKQAEGKRQQLQQEEAARRNQLDAAEQHFRKISRQTQEQQIALLHQRNKLHELQQKQNFLHQTLSETTRAIQRNENDATGYQQEIGHLKEQISQTRQVLEELYSEHDGVEKVKLEVEKSFESLKLLISSREDEQKKITRRWNQTQERLQELELHIQEIEVKQKSLREQMEERFGEDFEALLEEVEIPEEVHLNDVQEKVRQLRSKIESLGEVNPLAVKEYDREKERLDFLKAQEADLLEAKTELMETISKLNKTARKLFLETFEQINSNFKEVFSKFFEGGKAELNLVENSDPLESNIEITIQIKGRKLSTLTLMSAGEKTLTAISLLFAIYLVKPSPFCILDEVDAPLDDVNISRFTHAIREFSRNTQFILVTHNKMTMQAAKAMYGITMEEPGVSKVVSVRFD
ncbi:MAG: chromosome segregation protein SMC [Calditrichia bacterium]